MDADELLDDDVGDASESDYVGSEANGGIGHSTSEDVKVVETVDETDLREIGSQAVWSVSSAKPSFGVQRLRDGDSSSFWQSDATQPHYIDVQFNKMVSLAVVAIQLNVDEDESYTPQRIALSGGTTDHDLEVYRRDDVDQPNGWVVIPLSTSMASGEAMLDDAVNANEPPRLSMLKILVLQNHENGRDSRIRGIRVYAPRVPAYVGAGLPRFSTVAMEQFATLR